MCLYMSSSMFTFSNIIIATDGQSQASQCETRSCFALAPPSHGTASERSERYLLIMIRNKGGLARLGTGKKERAKRAVRFAVPHWGLTGCRRIRIGQTKLCHFFRVKSVYLVLLFLFSLFYIVYHRPSVKLKCSYIFLFI